MDLYSLFAASPSALGRVLLVGLATYVFLVALLRVSGKRTLSKLNAFDLVVTIALGSTLSSVILDRNIPFAEGALALSLLVACQFAATWLSMRSAGFRRLIKNEPALLVLRGELMQDAMRRERVTEDEIRAALRAAGCPGLESASAVVLETDGTLSVIAGTVEPGEGVPRPQ